MTEQQLNAMKQMVEAVEADLNLFNIPLTARMVEALNAGRTAIEQADLQARLKAANDQVGRLFEENQRLLAANRDCIDHFNQIKADHDALKAQGQEPVARLHVYETDTYPDIEVEVMNGATLQPSMSPINVYTTPPETQRQWVGLTEAEATEIWEGTDDRDSWELIMRVQAKLKEKNT